MAMDNRSVRELARRAHLRVVRNKYFYALNKHLTTCVEQSAYCIKGSKENKEKRQTLAVS